MMEKAKEWPATKYTNDQPTTMEPGASSTQTIYVLRPSNHSSRLKRQLKRSLDNLTTYKVISVRANPEKTQVTAFHPRNKDAKRSLKVVWNKTELENTTHPKYPGVTLDRSLSYKQYIQNTKMKVAIRNN